ncbi:hypothetical protein PVK06_024728 [Gossypium arboreum]|uniref:Uncharacterized protein n=1 Tax=Gossypium arboreum TaxID=29729 RepID=A0ABR0PEK2_GOSAR|nr:hypothetical protein PVK06_024728 [Gossypium arboreum]
MGGFVRCNSGFMKSKGDLIKPKFLPHVTPFLRLQLLDVVDIVLEMDSQRFWALILVVVLHMLQTHYSSKECHVISLMSFLLHGSYELLVIALRSIPIGCDPTCVVDTTSSYELSDYRLFVNFPLIGSSKLFDMARLNFPIYGY